MQTRIPTSLLLTLGAVLLVLTSADEAQARPGKRIEFLNGGRGVKSLPVDPRSESAPRSRPAVRVEGIAQWDGRDGLRIGKTSVNIGPSAAVHPSSSARSALLDPASLAGQQVTIFGYRIGSQVEAVLVISSGDEGERVRSIAKPTDQKNTIPSEVDPSVGEIRSGAPE